MPTTSVEDYLKAIYHLEQVREGPVRTKAIAERLSLTPPSVTNMLKSLAAEGLLDYVPYQGVSLTRSGMREALRTIRKHRLIEVFLTQTLGLAWDEVHREAEALEHAVSDRLADRIDVFLGFPEADPHGDPIPRSDGTIQRPDGIRLCDLPHRTPSTVVRVLEQSPDVLRYLGELGLTPGVELRVEREEPFDGPLFLRVGAESVALSHYLAQRIVVARP